MLKALGKAGIGAVALCLLLASPGLAQDSDADIKKEIESLKEGQKNIQKQLQELKKLIQSSNRPPARRGPAVKDVVFNLSGHDIKGEDTAKLTMVEFTDYQ